MEHMDLEGRIRQLKCLLLRAEKEKNIGLICYYQALIGAALKNSCG